MDSIMVELIRIGLKEGMGAVAIGAGIWMLYYLIKHLINSVTDGLNTLVENSKVFYSKVRDEHNSTIKNQEELMKQHRELTEILRSINNRVQ
jgi:Mg2+ and Co2+ transporter CorA